MSETTYAILFGIFLIVELIGLGIIILMQYEKIKKTQDRVWLGISLLVSGVSMKGVLVVNKVIGTI